MEQISALFLRCASDLSFAERPTAATVRWPCKPSMGWRKPGALPDISLGSCVVPHVEKDHQLEAVDVVLDVVDEDDDDTLNI